MSDDPSNWVYVTVVANTPGVSYPPGADEYQKHASFSNPLAQPIRFPYGSRVQVALYKMTYQLRYTPPESTSGENPTPAPINSFYISSDVVASNQLVGSETTTTLRKVTLENTVPVVLTQEIEDKEYPTQHVDLESGNPWNNPSNGANFTFDKADLGPVATFRRFKLNVNTPEIKYYERIKGSTTHWNVYNNKPIVGSVPDNVTSVDPSTYVLGGALSPTNTPAYVADTTTEITYQLPGDKEYVPQELRWVECSGSELTAITTVISDDSQDPSFDSAYTSRFATYITLTYVFRILPEDSRANLVL